jgi:hypothetical protein
MPAAVALCVLDRDRIASYEMAMRAAGRKTGRSTMAAARSFCAKLDRAGGWDRMSRARQLDAIGKARSFASWLMVTGRLTVDADIFGRVYSASAPPPARTVPTRMPGSSSRVTGSG